uniref:(northern house mosquito) hypothetical protein n=1 Tax=Culex pipiens TaxID=7175 RepID=A0A8D7ZZU7_CULPI
MSMEFQSVLKKSTSMLGSPRHCIMVPHLNHHPLDLSVSKYNSEFPTNKWQNKSWIEPLHFWKKQQLKLKILLKNSKHCSASSSSVVITLNLLLSAGQHFEMLLKNGQNQFNRRHCTPFQLRGTVAQNRLQAHSSGSTSGNSTGTSSTRNKRAILYKTGRFRPFLFFVFFDLAQTLWWPSL